MINFDPESWTWERPPIEPLDDIQIEEVINIINDYEEAPGIDTSRDGRLSPKQVEGLMHPNIDTDGSFRPDNVVTFTGAALVAQTAIETAVEHNQDKIPGGVRLPGVVHDFLNGIYEKYPLDDNPAIGDTLRDHAPRLMLGAVITAGAVGLTRQLMENRHHNRIMVSAEDVRGVVEERQRTGTLRWNMPEDFTLAFVGSGDMISSILARRNPHSFMQIAYHEVEGLWTGMPDASNSHRPILEALDRADASRSKKVFYLPMQTSEEFLPGSEEYDIPPDRVVGYIQDLDFYCREAGIPLKSVVVIGNMQQTQSYAEATHSHNGTWDLPASTLGQKLRLLKNGDLARGIPRRGAPIQMVDPNERVKGRILKIAGDRPVSLVNTKESVGKYAEPFFWMIRDRQKVDTEKPRVRVLYGRRDWSTLQLAEEDDIAVVESYTQRQALIDKGMPSGRIILVPEITLEEVDSHAA